MDETIMSGFFSAFFTFSQSLSGADIEKIDIGERYQIIFESAGNTEILFVAICDAFDSLINIKKLLKEVKNFTILKFGDKIKIVGCDLSCNSELDEFIAKSIVNSYQLDFQEDYINKYQKILDALESNEEILDSALISSTGVTASSDKDKEFLNLMIRQMEAFFRLTGRILDQIILQFQNRYIILFRINQDLVLSCLTKRNVPIGIATLLAEEAALKIAKINK